MAWRHTAHHRARRIVSALEHEGPLTSAGVARALVRRAEIDDDWIEVEVIEAELVQLLERRLVDRTTDGRKWVRVA